ncbi:MAG: helix-turn-helix domain-containing protein, partial [Nitrospiraceae bacterium]
MKNQKKAEAIAVERFQLLAPLVVQYQDAAKVKQLRTEICKQTGLSDRTLRRYMSKYREGGFTALAPLGKERKPLEEAVPANILEQAILLRREVPGRSVSQIIQILEWEGLVAPGSIKRSTLQEKLARRGFSSRQMRMYADTGTAARRFQKR